MSRRLTADPHAKGNGGLEAHLEIVLNLVVVTPSRVGHLKGILGDHREIADKGANHFAVWLSLMVSLKPIYLPYLPGP